MSAGSRLTTSLCGTAGEYFVVPRDVVAKYVRESHQEWLNTPGRNGQKHADTSMRKFGDPNAVYLERWDLLGLDRVLPE